MKTWLRPAIGCLLGLWLAAVTRCSEQAHVGPGDGWSPRFDTMPNDVVDTATRPDQTAADTAVRDRSGDGTGYADLPRPDASPPDDMADLVPAETVDHDQTATDGADIADVTTPPGPACRLDSDCAAGFFCKTLWNGATDPADIAWQHRCEPRPAGAATLGQTCSPDGVAAPTCADPDLCRDGICSGPCLNDADCSAAAGQVCAAAGFEFDVDQNGQPDALLTLGRCRAIADGSSACLSRADCPADQSCVPYPVADLQTISHFGLAGRCGHVPGGSATFAETCDPAGATCRSGLCIPYAAAGFCTELCRSHNDCPSGVPFRQWNANGICQSLPFDRGGSLQPESRIYMPICFPDFGSTLDDCAATLSCGFGETCVPYLIATGPEQVAAVEYLCTYFGIYQGLALGESCTSLTACQSGLCLTPQGSAAGYCSQLCQDDSECAAAEGFVCHADVVLRRPDPAFNATIGRCRRVQSCLVCQDDADCPGSYRCVDSGGGDLRCAPPCVSAADCIAVDGGPDCKAAANPRGTQVLTCLPSCQAPASDDSAR